MVDFPQCLPNKVLEARGASVPDSLALYRMKGSDKAVWRVAKGTEVTVLSAISCARVVQ